MADYISRTHYGDVVRRADGAVVAPTGDDQSPDYLAWLAWCEAGNTPDVDDTFPAEVAPVPDSISPKQIRLALNHMGLRAEVEAAVAAADPDTRDVWEFATEIRRDDPMLSAMSASLGYSSSLVDDVFRLAATL
jgi:hypothetical protein